MAVGPAVASSRCTRARHPGDRVAIGVAVPHRLCRLCCLFPRLDGVPPALVSGYAPRRGGLCTAALESVIRERRCTIRSPWPEHGAGRATVGEGRLVAREHTS